MAERIKVVKAVLDTNIFLRALFRKGNISDKVIGLWEENKFLLVTSKNSLKEIERVLKYPWLVEKYDYDLEQVDRLTELISQKAIFVEPPFSLHLCRDPDDNKFVDCSALGRVQFLVSEDGDLLNDENLKKQLFEYGVEVLNALNFYETIKKYIDAGASL